LETKHVEETRKMGKMAADSSLFLRVDVTFGKVALEDGGGRTEDYGPRANGQ
jgi:hypothetical protein